MPLGGMPATSRHARVALTLLAALCFAQWPATHARTAATHHRVVAAFFGAAPQAAGPAAPKPTLRFTTPSAGVAAAPDVATLTVPGPGSNFKVPYIQAGPDFAYAVDAANLPANGEVAVTLDAGSPAAATQVIDSAPYAGTFSGVGYGEHTLTAAAVDPLANRGAGRVLASTSLHNVARGDIVAALGDSTTEGLGGPASASYPTGWRRAMPSRSGSAPTAATTRSQARLSTPRPTSRSQASSARSSPRPGATRSWS